MTRSKRSSPVARPGAGCASGRVGDLLRLVEHLEDPLAGGDGALARADPHAEHPQRHDEHEHVDVERDELAERELAVDDAVPAGEEHRGLREERQEGEERHVERALARRLGSTARTPPRSARANFASSRGSWANALTTLTPTMFSSATVVMSAIRCWTSLRIGCDAREYW